MTLKEYFQHANGKGLLATSDSAGKVGIAIYSKPHFNEDGSLAFIMRERLTHHNLQTNPYAAYMYIEQGDSYAGIRLQLKKITEVRDDKLIASLSQRNLSPAEDRAAGAKFLVYFSVEGVLPLIGAGQSNLSL
ncbi:MAG: hypothetical protein P1P81_11150 [Desulfobulbales bacterium]|nr:hypothetical protein [Desulfobulbales bacterium]